MSLVSRTRTLLELIGYFCQKQRFFLLPLLVVVLLGGALFLATSGLSYMTPFVYTLF